MSVNYMNYSTQKVAVNFFCFSLSTSDHYLICTCPEWVWISCRRAIFQDTCMFMFLTFSSSYCYVCYWTGFHG